MNPWFRMYHEFSTDPKIQMLSEKDQRRYIMLLCLKCCNGDVTLQDSEVAFQLRINNNEYAETKKLLIERNLIDEGNKPTAWEKRQFKSDSSRERVSAFRERQKKHLKQKCNVTVTAQETDTDTDTDTDTEVRKSRGAHKRGSRLPQDWKPTREQINFILQERPDLDPASVTERFHDYWIAQPGSKGFKLDWSATFRNWVRNERPPPRITNGGKCTSGVEQWLEDQGVKNAVAG